MNELYSSLLQLQELDQEIETAQSRVAGFDPRLEEIRGPITTIEREQDQIRGKLEDLGKQQRKLGHGVHNKRDRLRIFEEKAAKSRNQRDESEVRAEIDFVRRAVEAEEAEQESVNDQIRRLELRLEELDRSIARIAEELRPQLDELEAQRHEASDTLKVLQDRRTNHTLRIDGNSVRLYERVRTGKRKVALAALTADGACASCYNVLPPQEQSEIRQGTSLHRCEACGVILYPAETS